MLLIDEDDLMRRPEEAEDCFVLLLFYEGVEQEEDDTVMEDDSDDVDHWLMMFRSFLQTVAAGMVLEQHLPTNFHNRIKVKHTEEVPKELNCLFKNGKHVQFIKKITVQSSSSIFRLLKWWSVKNEDLHFSQSIIDRSICRQL